MGVRFAVVPAHTCTVARSASIEGGGGVWMDYRRCASNQFSVRCQASAAAPGSASKRWFAPG